MSVLGVILQDFFYDFEYFSRFWKSVRDFYSFELKHLAPIVAPISIISLPLFVPLLEARLFKFKNRFLGFDQRNPNALFYRHNYNSPSRRRPASADWISNHRRNGTCFSFHLCTRSRCCTWSRVAIWLVFRFPQWDTRPAARLSGSGSSWEFDSCS